MRFVLFFPLTGFFFFTVRSTADKRMTSHQSHPMSGWPVGPSDFMLGLFMNEGSVNPKCTELKCRMESELQNSQHPKRLIKKCLCCWIFYFSNMSIILYSDIGIMSFRCSIDVRTGITGTRGHYNHQKCCCTLLNVSQGRLLQYHLQGEVLVCRLALIADFWSFILI